LKALIIEDSVEVAEAVSLCLQVQWPDIEISVAVEGFIGLERLKSGQYDVIILDLNLPDVSGYDVLQQIRLFSNIPVIILTVSGEEEDIAKGFEMGANDYIVKPFRPRDLLSRINSAINRSPD